MATTGLREDILQFREVRMPFGRALVARGTDGSLYAYGRPEAGAPPCAWRQTPAGDRQWLAFDVARQAEGTHPCRRVAAAVAAGERLVGMDWPMWDSRGIATERRVPVRVTRDADGITFQPIAGGVDALHISNARIRSFVSGKLPINLPGQERDSWADAQRFLVAARDTKHLLTPGERLRAGAALVALASGLGPREPSRRLLERCLDRFCAAVTPMLELHSPNERILGIAKQEVARLASAPAGVLGPQGRAWLGGEASPLLASLEERLRAHRVEQRFREEIDLVPVGPAFA